MLRLGFTVGLVISAALFGIGLMIVDELFTIMSEMNSTVDGTTYHWPITIPYLMTTNAASIWTAWEVAFVWIIGSVVGLIVFSLLLLVTMRRRR